MNLLILGRGKTGSLVAEVARERGHDSHAALRGGQCPTRSALTPQKLARRGCRDRFHHARRLSSANIEACVGAGKNMVVGTTGWYGDLDEVRQLVEKSRHRLSLWREFFHRHQPAFRGRTHRSAESCNISIRDRSSSATTRRRKTRLRGRRRPCRRSSATHRASELEITSFREGDVVGMHEIVLDSPNDTIYLCHDSKSRRGFAEGAVRAAEWLAGKKGFFDFKDIWRET